MKGRSNGLQGATGMEPQLVRTLVASQAQNERMAEVEIFFTLYKPFWVQTCQIALNVAYGRAQGSIRCQAARPEADRGARGRRGYLDSKPQCSGLTGADSVIYPCPLLLLQTPSAVRFAAAFPSYKQLQLLGTAVSQENAIVSSAACRHASL